ncbi:MAG TPA: ATP-binding protein [Chthoniobacter sp.]|jgi:signal transduction histidine kinase
MIHFRLGTRIALWSACVVAAGMLACGTAGALYVHHKERIELDEDLAAAAKQFFRDWRHYGGKTFDWSHNEKLVRTWFPTTSSAIVVEVIDRHGRVLYRSRSVDDDFLRDVRSGFRSITHRGTHWRVGVFEKDGVTLRIGGDLQEVNELAQELAMTYFVTMPIVLVCVLVGSRLIARKALSPIREIADFAEHITAQGLGQRIPVPPARDEIRRLSTVLNETFDRLEKSFHQANRFSADASHELKTPLTVLRTSVEALLRSPTLDLENQQGLSSILEDTKRLSAITESLLLLSRADAGKLKLDLQPGDLAELVALCADDAGILFEEQGIELERELPTTAAALLDRPRLSQVLMNLLDNALKYNSPKGRVRIALVAEDSTWEVRVANTGPGIPKEHVARLFTRFFRGEHSSEIPGQGLGLSLSRELARAHHGDLVLVESEPGWTRFVLILPKLPPAETPANRELSVRAG